MSQSIELVPVIVLAGGIAKPEDQLVMGIPHRALMIVNGMTMLEHIIQAVKACPFAGPITVIGNMPPSPDYTCLPDQGSLVENVFAGVKACGNASHALIATSDIPFITEEVVSDFLSKGRMLEADLVYPIVHVERCYQKYPGLKRTAIKLKDGQFTGGNLMLVSSEFIRTNRVLIAQTYAARKSPLRLAMMMGPLTLLRLLIAITIWPGALSITQLETAAGRMLNGTAKGLISDYPEIATDIDRPEELKTIVAIH